MTETHPQEYNKLATFSPEEVLPYLTSITGEKKREYAGQMVNMHSQRYELFAKKGMRCVFCGLEGTHFTLEKMNGQDTYHFNCYGTAPDGVEVMITKDHIIPRSRGGANHIDNYNPCCYWCNQAKGNGKGTMRKLASIQEITDIQPIKGADRIERLSVLGWHCVGMKGEYKVGQKVVYFEVDSVLPEREEFEFMRQYKFRVKTIKLRKQVSQGLCFPMDKLGLDPNLEVGTDVTDELGVVKYLPPAAGLPNSDVIGSRPSYTPKTDEQRIQSHPDLINEMRGRLVYCTTKVHGTSCTIAHMDGEFTVSTRRNQLAEAEKNPYWQAAKKYNFAEWLPKVGNYAVQGEVAGPGINGNHLGLEEIDFFAFNVWDIENHCYLDCLDFLRFCADNGIPTVEVDFMNVEFDWDMDQLKEMAKGKYPLSKYPREGIVIRPMEESYSEVLRGRMSFKVINEDHDLAEK